MIHHKYCAQYVSSEAIHTIFYDGTETIGIAPKDEAFWRAALAFGYGDSDAELTRRMIWHDILHEFTAEEYDDAPSVSLWNQAHDQQAYRWKIWPEMRALVDRDEARVGAFEAALNFTRYPPPGDPFAAQWAYDAIREMEKERWPSHDPVVMAMNTIHRARMKLSPFGVPIDEGELALMRSNHPCRQPLGHGEAMRLRPKPGAGN